MTLFEPYISILAHLIRVCDLNGNKDCATRISEVKGLLTKPGTTVKLRLEAISTAIDKIKDITATLNTSAWIGKVIKKTKVKLDTKAQSKFENNLQCAVTILQVTILSCLPSIVSHAKNVVVWVQPQMDILESEIDKLTERKITVKTFEIIEQASEYLKQTNDNVKVVTELKKEEDNEEASAVLISEMRKNKKHFPLLVFTESKDDSISLADSYPEAICTHRESILTMYFESFEKQTYVIYLII